MVGLLFALVARQDLRGEWKYRYGERAHVTAEGTTFAVVRATEGETNRHALGLCALPPSLPRAGRLTLAGSFSFGKLGNVGSALELRAGKTVFLRLGADAVYSAMSATIDGRQVWQDKADSVVRHFTLVITPNATRLRIDTTDFPWVPTRGMPDLMTLGSTSSAKGVQTEMRVELSRLIASMPTPSHASPTIVRRREFSTLPLTVAIVSVEKADPPVWGIGNGVGNLPDRAEYRFKVRFTNRGNSTIDGTELPMLQYFFDDYNQWSALAYCWSGGVDGRFSLLKPGDVSILPGQSTIVDFLGEGPVSGSSARIVRAQMYQRGFSLPLPLPAP